MPLGPWDVLDFRLNAASDAPEAKGRISAGITSCSMTAFSRGCNFGGALPGGGGAGAVQYQFKGNRIIVCMDLVESHQLYRSTHNKAAQSLKETHPQ